MTPWGDNSMWSPDSGRNRPKYIDISDSITGETNQSFHVVGSPIVQYPEGLRIETDPNRICPGTLERRNIELRSGYYGSKSTTFTGRPCLDWNKITSRPARPELENLFTAFLKLAESATTFASESYAKFRTCITVFKKLRSLIRNCAKLACVSSCAILRNTGS